jgi:KDO2-lipid IV(A) lauroyltransferase
MTPRSSIQYRLEYAGLLLFNAVLRALPDKVAIGLGRNAGALAGKILRARVRLAHENLQIVFGESLSPAQRENIIEKLFRMLGEGFVESVISSPADLLNNVSVEGLEHLKDALAKKRGVIILGPHMGMWEHASSAFAQYVDDAASLYKPLKNPYVDAYMIRTRGLGKIKLISSKNGLRQIYQRLKKGGMVTLLFDQNAGRNGLPVPFFGKIASTYSAPAAFALKTGCAVVPAYTIKEPGFRRNRTILGEQFPLIQTGNMESDIIANTRQYNAFIEDLVRRYPEQWFGWLHRRWKLPRAFAENPAGGEEAQ